MIKRCVDCPFECPYVDAARHFYVRARGHFESRCKACTKARGQAWAEANRERKHAIDKARRERIAADPELEAERRDQRNEHHRKRRLSRRKDAQPGERVQPHERLAHRTKEQFVLVDPAPVREAIRASGETKAAIGHRAGMDETQIRAVFTRDTITAIKATTILEALSLDPAQVGL